MTQEIEIRDHIAADVGEVWALLEDSSTWPAWTPIDSFELERKAGPDGLGEIRRFTTGRVSVREEIVEKKRERRLTYELLSGLAVRDYRAEIDVTAVEPDQTAIHWHTTFKAKVPGTGWVYRRALEKATRAFVDGLAEKSHRPD